jgi:MerR family redox-sensitive transcriptional activator SoxR
MTHLPIGEVARRTGLRASAIRYYEQAGLLPSPPRTSGQRRYDPSILDRIALIQFAQQAGFTVAEIRTLFEGFEEETPASERWQILAQQKLDEVNAMIDRAERMKVVLGQALACGCLRLDDCARVIRASNASSGDACC